MGITISPADFLALSDTLVGHAPKYRQALRGYGKECRPGDYIEITTPWQVIQGILLRIEDKPPFDSKTDTAIQLLIQTNPFAGPQDSGWTSMRLLKGSKVTRVFRGFLQMQNSLLQP